MKKFALLTLVFSVFSTVALADNISEANEFLKKKQEVKMGHVKTDGNSTLCSLGRKAGKGHSLLGNAGSDKDKTQGI